MTKVWLEAKLLEARKAKLAERDADSKDEPKLNTGKRIVFLELLGLIKNKNDVLTLTEFGKACLSDEKLLLKKMAAVYPILSRSYYAIHAKDENTFKDIVHIDPASNNPGNPSQSLRDAIHWLAAFGLISEEKIGNAYHFCRKRSRNAFLLPPP